MPNLAWKSLKCQDLFHVCVFDKSKLPQKIEKQNQHTLNVQMNVLLIKQITPNHVRTKSKFIDYQGISATPNSTHVN